MDSRQQLILLEKEYFDTLKIEIPLTPPSKNTAIGLDAKGTAASTLTFLQLSKESYNLLLKTGLSIGAYFAGKQLTKKGDNWYVYNAKLARVKKYQKLAFLRNEIFKLRSIIESEIKTAEIEKKRLYDENLKRKLQLEAEKPENSIISAKDYRKLSIPTYIFPDNYSELLGEPSRNFYMIVTGAPGNGKTTFSVRFAHYFGRNFGKVLYLQAEQAGNNSDFQKLIYREQAYEFDIERYPMNYTIDELIERCTKYDLIILDSVNYMDLKPSDLRHFRKELPRTAMLTVMQYTKEGSFRGSLDYMHDCDIFLDMEAQGAFNKKARTAEPTRIPIHDLPLE